MITGAMFATVLSVIVVVLYFSSAVLIARALQRGDDFERRDQWLRLAPAVFGLVLHGIALSSALFVDRGLDLGFYNALSLTAFAIVAALVVLNLIRPAITLGVGLLPIAALSVLATALVDTPSTTQPIAVELQFHIAVSILAYGVLSVAAMQAIVVGLQAHMLHSHQPGGLLRRLPPLNLMESLLFQLIAVGFVLLSIGLASGFMYLHDMFGQHVAHKTVLSLSAWVVFGALLVGRVAWGWRGLRAVRWTLAGLALLLLAFFGSKLVLELLLQRG